MTKLLAVLLSSFIIAVVNGRCVRDVEDVYQEEDFTASVGEMLQAYGEKCEEAATCEFSNYEDTLNSLTEVFEEAGIPTDSIPTDISSLNDMSIETVKKLFDEAVVDVDQQAVQDILRKNSPPVVLKAKLEFTTFTSDATYEKYVTECSKLGAEITNVEVEFVAKGDTVFKTFAQGVTDTGIKMDIDVTMTTVPVCLPSSCDDEEDLAEIVDEILKIHLQNDPDIAKFLDEIQIDGDFDPKIILNFASFNGFCVLGENDGLQVCDFNVERSNTQPVGNKSLPGTTSGGASMTLTRSVAAIISFMAVSFFV